MAPPTKRFSQLFGGLYRILLYRGGEEIGDTSKFGSGTGVNPVPEPSLDYYRVYSRGRIPGGSLFR